MTPTVNDFNPVKFRKYFSYDKQTPTFVSNNIGASDEIARWVLDINDILYKDEPHAPRLSTAVANKLTGEPGLNNIPNALQKELYLQESTPTERLAYIKAIFKQVDDLLNDRRKYLAGDTLTLADIAFASVSAPLILPDEFGGLIAEIGDTPDELYLTLQHDN